MREKNISTIEETLNQLLDERELLISQIDLSERTISFWENQMEKVFSDIDESEKNSWHPDYKSRSETHLKKIRELTARGKMEYETVSILEKKCDTLYEEITDFLEEYGKRPKIKRIAKERISRGI